MPLVGGEKHGGGHNAGIALRDTAPSEKASGCRDKILLVSVALLVCMIMTGSFLLTLIHHVNAVWVFVAGNSIVMVPIFIRDFRSHLRKPSFVAFLFAWALIHGLLVATLMRWMSILAMLPVLAVELTVGFVLADYLFGIRPEPKRAGGPDDKL